MKKHSVTAALCLIIMLFQSLAISSLAEEPASDGVSEPLASDELELFNEIGIIPEQMKLMEASGMTRGEFAYIIAALSGYVDGGGAIKGIFADVTADLYYAGAVEYLYDIGVVTGFGADFRPYDVIIYDEAAAMSVKAIGYKDVIGLYGEYPSSIRIISQKENFFDGLAGRSYTDEVKTGDGLVFLRNVADTGTIEENLLNTSENNGYQHGDTLLYKYHRIISANGKMTDNGITSINGESCVSSDGAIIGDVSVYIDENQSRFRDYIGERLDFWYNEDTERLVYARADEKHNDAVSLSYSQIDSGAITTAEIPYFAASGSSKKRIAKISPYADVIYNGKAFPDFGAADLAIRSGFMTLIDDNNDSEYDTIRINEYKEYVVAAVNAANNQIFAEGLTLNLEDYDNVFITDTEGAAKELSSLTMDTPVMVAVSKDNKSVVRITDCRTLTVRGMASRFIPDGEDVYIVIGTETYKYADSFKEKLASGKYKAPEFNTEYNFYMNTNGDVFGFTAAKKSTDWYTGYAIAIHVGENDGEPGMMARIKMQDSTLLKLNFCRNFELNGSRIAVESALEAPELFYKNSSGEALPKRQPIQFKLNEWGEISAVKTAKDITAEEYPYDENEFSLDLSFPNGATFKGEYIKAIQGVYMVTGSTVIIKDPYLGDSRPNYDDKDVLFMTSEDLYSVTDMPRCSLYDIDKNSNIGILVYKSDPGSSQWKDNLLLVDKVYEALDDDGGVVKRLDCIIAGSAKKMEPYSEDVSFEGLKRGDVCRYKIQNEKILAIEKIMSLKEPGEAKYVLGNGIEDTLVSYTWAPVFSVSSAGVTVAAPSEASANGNKYKIFGNSFNNNKTKVAVYDVPNDTVKAGSISSIYANVVPDARGNVVIDDKTTRIFLYRRWGYLCEAVFVIY